MNIKDSMKIFCKHLPLSMLFIIGLFYTSYSQETDTIIPIRKNPEKILKHVEIGDVTRNGLNLWPTKFSGHFSGVDFGFNMFVNEDYSGYDYEFMENDIFRSNSAYINVFQQSFGVQKNKNTFGLVTGMGLQLQSYRLNDNTTFYKDEADNIQPDYVFYDDDQKSKFANVLVTVPLLAEFQIPVNHFDNRIYVSAGFLGSIRIKSHTKIKYRADQKEKIKTVNDFSMPRFRYSLMFRTGYRWFNVFATYDLVPLFKEDKGPELTPFTFGITLLRF
jgi:hypothetical protein